MTESQLGDGSPAAPAHPRDAASILRNPLTIRQRCVAITQAVADGRSSHFRLERGRLRDVAQHVAQVTRAAYPSLQIPYHSRWRHFEAGGVDRKSEMDAQLTGHGAAEAACARIDLTVISVLLDAGAGPQWAYDEAQSGQRFTRSEGLGVASFRAFMRGDFSVVPADPLRVDAAALLKLDAVSLGRIFQCTPQNPLVGLEGRAALLNRLGEALLAHAKTHVGLARPAALFETLTRPAPGSSTPVTDISASALLRALLDLFAPIWTSGSVLHGVPLGDVWPHPWAGGEDSMSGRHGTTAGWVPFHKLSQWLAYSLLEPFEWAGISVQQLDSLTGLPEYRNGGLLLDGGVIVPRDPASLEKTWKVSDEFIVEWRALTVSLLDELAPLVRGQLGLSAEQMPLARVLEGGTWAAGRAMAMERRGGTPPLTITSDGTVF